MRKHATEKEMQELDKMLRKRYPSAYAEWQERNIASSQERRDRRLMDKV